ncbi:MAG TPA: hypothetical protein VHX88_02260 [Solirubrobacteraceae bacterium]|nr:hypothetical protein [Solirubrobacteraceae bacterium]
MAEDRCPGVLRLHEAADGGLARVRLPGGRIDARGLAAVARAAERLGNGIVELTSRAGLQIRGLGLGLGLGEDLDALAALLTDGDLLPSPAHERVRNLLAPPLAGADTHALVQALDEGLCADPALSALPGRFCFAVDDGSGALAPLRADVELVPDEDGRMRLWLDGRATTSLAPPARAAGLALDAARAFLEHSAGEWRVRDLGAQRLASIVSIERPAPAAGLRRLGVLAAGAVAVLPPLARLDPDQLHALAALDPDLRLSPWKTMTLVDRPHPERTLAELLALGLIADAHSGWVGLSACAGLGACARARVDVRAAATVRARQRGPGAPIEHHTACERRCGEPPDVQVSVVPEPVLAR